MTSLDIMWGTTPKCSKHWVPANTYRIEDQYRVLRSIVTKLRDVENLVCSESAFDDLAEHVTISFNRLTFLEREMGELIREQNRWQNRNQA